MKILIPKNDFDEMLILYKHIKKDEPNSFVYVHEYDTLFINWNELIFDDSDDDDDDDDD